MAGRTATCVNFWPPKPKSYHGAALRHLSIEGATHAQDHILCNFAKDARHIRRGRIRRRAVEPRPCLRLAVFDAANFLKNTISAAQALKTEVYENTNIIYQYKMMLNQLQQAVGLDDIKNQAQIDSILADVKRYSDYGQVLQQLYGAVSSDASFLDKVNGLVVVSGKSPAQWFEDQRTLLTSGNKTAQALFDAGTDVAKNIAHLAQRRQDLQSQMTLSPTAQATAQTTNQYLDLLSSQNADLIKLIGTKVQADAVKDRKENADTEEKRRPCRA